jgi:glycosyltransferase involved in cell wall biosynthesis
VKVLISAYACEPGGGSEPGAGWVWALAAARAGHEVWLVTRENNRDAVEAALGRERGLGVHPVYFDLPDRWRRWKRGPRGVRLYYTLWQFGVRRLARRLHARHRFHVAHHLTFAVDWLPAGVVGLPELPSVWGPVGGAGSVPLSLYRWLGVRGTVTELLREGPVRLLRGVLGARTARRADVVVAQNDTVARRFSAVRRVVVEPNIAVQSFDFGCGRTRARETAVFAGRLVPWKGVAIAVAALACIPSWRLRVIGEGPDRARLERLAARKGVGDRVEFLGQLPRSEVLAEMRRATTLVLPSMHDSAGWVVGEALASGTPVVALDLAGPATVIRRSAGGRVVSASWHVADEFARAMREVVPLPEATHQWTDERLPALLSAIYESADAAGRSSRRRTHRASRSRRSFTRRAR